MDFTYHSLVVPGATNVQPTMSKEYFDFRLDHHVRTLNQNFPITENGNAQSEGGCYDDTSLARHLITGGLLMVR